MEAQTLNSAGQFAATAAAAGCSDRTIAAAWRHITHGDVIGLTVSGKLASGKDTVAELALMVTGDGDAIHQSFATPLKAEFNTIIDICRTADSGRDATAAVAATLGLTVADSSRMVELAYDEVRADETLTAYSRTDRIRTALQELGTDIRRGQDGDYWVKKAITSIVDVYASGRSVFFTDCRFPNEADGSRWLAMCVVRLDVTAETQRKRLYARDALAPDPQALAHPSEIALDDYPHFDLRVNNDGALPPVVREVADLLVVHRQRFRNM
jgi:dephospho-CoA kinase